MKRVNTAIRVVVNNLGSMKMQKENKKTTIKYTLPSSMEYNTDLQC